MARFLGVVRLPLAGSGKGAQALLQVGQVQRHAPPWLTHIAQRNLTLLI